MHKVIWGQHQEMGQKRRAETYLLEDTSHPQFDGDNEGTGRESDPG